MLTMEKATVVEVFPRGRKQSLITHGLAMLGGGRVVEFAGLFARHEEKYLVKGTPIRGYLSKGTVLRNVEITS